MRVAEDVRLQARPGVRDWQGESHVVESDHIPAALQETRMVIVIADTGSVPNTAPIQLSLHVVATLDITADEARRRVNRAFVAELGTGLIARDPELVVGGEQIAWRVPIVLSLPGLGDLGQVGVADVDARSGQLLLADDAQDRIVQHARRLYAGATLQAE
jgi:hypothetical protein